MLEKIILFLRWDLKAFKSFQFFNWFPFYLSECRQLISSWRPRRWCWGNNLGMLRLRKFIALKNQCEGQPDHFSFRQVSLTAKCRYFCGSIFVTMTSWKILHDATGSKLRGRT